tara:strand:- start:52 stop:402 length:351 start_codon:yes stop_codon:yes gene_type:complete
MRYYDTAIKNEIHEQDPDKVPATAIPMTDARVSAFFQELPANHQLTFDSDNLPIISEIPPPTTEEQAALDAEVILSNRRTEYPDIGDQLDDLYKAGAFSSTMTATLKAVKDKYPKE